MHIELVLRGASVVPAEVGVEVHQGIDTASVDGGVHRADAAWAAEEVATADGEVRVRDVGPDVAEVSAGEDVALVGEEVVIGNDMICCYCFVSEIMELGMLFGNASYLVIWDTWEKQLG